MRFKINFSLLIVILIHCVLSNNLLFAKEYIKKIRDWTFTYEVSGLDESDRKLNIQSKFYINEYETGYFWATFPIFLKQFPLELGGYDGSISPINEDEHIDGPDVFKSDSEIPTFKITGKEGKFFGFFETSAGASGGGGYSITLVNLDSGVQTRFNQDANGELHIVKDNNNITGFIHNIYMNRIASWHGDFPYNATYWGNLSNPNLNNLSDTMFRNHLEEKLKVLKPFTNEELKYLKEHQDGLTCEYTECYNRNLTSMDLYDSERKKIFQSIEKLIVKVIYQSEYGTKLIPDELSFLSFVIYKRLNYYSDIDLIETQKEFKKGKLNTDISYLAAKELCNEATQNTYKDNKWVKVWETDPDYLQYVNKAKKLNLSCEVS